MPRDDSPFERGRYRYSRINGREDDAGESTEQVEPAEGREGEARDASRRGRRSDRVIGVVLGLLLGIAIVVAFVFLGGEETIDAPGLEGVEPVREAPQRSGEGTGGAGR